MSTVRTGRNKVELSINHIYNKFAGQIALDLPWGGFARATRARAHKPLTDLKSLLITIQMEEL